MKCSKRKCICAFVVSLICIAVGGFLFFKINQTLCEKTSRNRMADFVENTYDKDILFIGTSHISNAIIPMQLWKEHGFSSYICYAGYDDLSRIPEILHMSLDYCSPKLIVLDVEDYWEKSDADVLLKEWHRFQDYFPMRRAKVEAALRLYRGNAKEILFPLIAYHDRWKELEEEDFRTEYSTYGKGSIIMEKTEPADGFAVYPDAVSDHADGYGLPVLDEFEAECNSLGIDVLYMTIPYTMDYDTQARFSALDHYLTERGCSYLNLMRENLVDPSTDFYNDSHLNHTGAVKITKYLGDYIGANYDLPIHVDDAVGEILERDAKSS